MHFSINFHKFTRQKWNQTIPHEMDQAEPSASTEEKNLKAEVNINKV